MKMWIDGQFDGGNVDVVAASKAGEIELRIRQDAGSSHRQWFYFRALGLKGQTCKFTIVNASEASYPEAWPDGTIVMSYDRKAWFRVKTDYVDGRLSFGLKLESDIVYAALTPPFSHEQHHELICRALQSPACSLLDCVSSVEGRQVEILQVGCPVSSSKPALDRKNVWIIARQHPAEAMAEWFMDGLLEQLLDPSEAKARTMLDEATFYLVPNMNPDGSVAGNLRTNAAGIDLNRAWSTASKCECPEVYVVLEHMKRIGVDLFLDIHGDEEFSFVFAAGTEGVPGYSDRLAELDMMFRQSFRKSNPDFSLQKGYPPDAPGEADLGIACNRVSEDFDCLSLTIELPFKDNRYLPDQVAGWSIQRSQRLGASILDPIQDILPRL